MRSWAVALAAVALFWLAGCAALHVESIPSGAKVLVDGKWNGEVTPADLRVRHLARGNHTITVEKDGYKMISPPQEVSVFHDGWQIVCSVFIIPIPFELAGDLWKNAQSYTGCVLSPTSPIWLDTAVLVKEKPDAAPAEANAGPSNQIYPLSAWKLYDPLDMPVGINIRDAGLAEAVSDLVTKANQHCWMIGLTMDKDAVGRVNCDLPYTTFRAALDAFLHPNGYAWSYTKDPWPVFLTTCNWLLDYQIHRNGALYVYNIRVFKEVKQAEATTTDASKKPEAPAATPATAAAAPAAPVAPASPAAYSDDSSVAVAIGISDYAFLGEIPGCKADAAAFADAFLKARGMNSKRVILMTDDGDKSHVPSKAMIEERIRTGLAEVQPDGMALVYFSGHAVMQDGHAVLVPKDCKASNGIPVSSVLALLEHSKARDKVLILDTCHAGAAEKGVLTVSRESFVNADGVAMFLSCNTDESSYPAEGGNRSIYTDVFLRCLQEAAASPSTITARSLEQKIEHRMSEWRLQTGKQQTPQLILSGESDVTLVPCGKKR